MEVDDIRRAFAKPQAYLKLGWWTLGWLVMWFLLWFSVFFTPLEMTRANLIIDGDTFYWENFSRKGSMANFLCSDPTNAQLVFEDKNLKTFTIDTFPNSRGTGDERIRGWPTQGLLPRGLAQGPVDVFKIVSYSCILGSYREIRSPIRSYNNLNKRDKP